MIRLLTVAINGHVVRVTDTEYDALRRDGATAEIVAAIQRRLNREAGR